MYRGGESVRGAPWTQSVLYLYFRFYTLCVYHFLCTYLVYIVSYLPIHRRPDYEISASGPPLPKLLAYNTEPEDGLYIGRNM